jgi:hypothetical protein
MGHTVVAAVGAIGAPVEIGIILAEDPWHSPTWGQAISILKQALALTPGRSLRLSHLGLDVVVPAPICTAIGLLVGAGAPGGKWFAAQAERGAPHWLQYGVCSFLLTVLSTEGGARFIYGQF